MPTPKAKAKAPAKPKAIKKVVVPPSNLIRVLTSVALINSAQFAKETPAVQTATLGQSGGKPIEFVPDFLALMDATKIRNDLLAGKDVTRELEFNAIKLTEADFTALKAVGPILTKIASVGPTYPWVDGTPRRMTFTDRRVTRNGHWISIEAAKALWVKASRFWSNQTSSARAPAETRIESVYTSELNSKYCNFQKNSVTIGCQTISRVDVEAIAKHYGWAPTMFKPK